MSEQKGENLLSLPRMGECASQKVQTCQKTNNKIKLKQFTINFMKPKNQKSTRPGRVRSYQEEPEKGLLPYSCKLRVYKNDIADTLQRTAKDLCWGAGVKIVLDNFEPIKPIKDIVWGFYLPESHPDFNKITDYQKQFLRNKEEFESFDNFIIKVADSMRETDLRGVSIEYSWQCFIEAIQNNERVIVDLSSLRPSGTTNSLGLTATGAVGDGSEESNTSSFLAIYDYIARYLTDGSIGSLLQLLGVLNSTIRRGGLYKNGIITSSMCWYNPSFREYLEYPLVDIPGSHKKSARVNNSVLEDSDLVDLIVDKVNTESLFLEKISKNGLYWNVCESLSMQDENTCLIWRVNLGQCKTFEDIVEAYKETARNLTNLHITWRKDNPEKALNSSKLEDDLQIGLDVMGLANCLRIWGIKYSEFDNALWYEERKDSIEITEGFKKALLLKDAIRVGMNEALTASDEIMLENNLKPLERIFCVEPAQSHSYETTDLEGYTTSRAIFPPYTRKVERKSDTQEIVIANHGKVETHEMVGDEVYQSVCEGWQKLMNETGRAHGISFDLRKPCDRDWFENWLLFSPLQTKYYTEYQHSNQNFLRKVANTVSEDPVSCGLRPDECESCAA